MVSVALAAGILALPANAAPVPYSQTPLRGWETNGRVFAVLVVGDTLYVGGEFTQLRSTTTGQTLARTNLAAFDVATTAPRTAFTANTNGRVMDLAHDGQRLYVAGAFSDVNGNWRNRLAAVDATTGAVQSFRTQLNSWAMAVEVLNGVVYVGGSFTQANGTARSRLAAVDAVTGAVISGFDPAPNNTVRDIKKHPAGYLYVAGAFSQIAGTGPGYIAALNASGTVVHSAFDRADTEVLALSIDPDGTRLYAGVAGYDNRVSTWDIPSRRRLWFETVDGDTQAVDYSQGNVYFGFHEGYQANTNLKMLVADKWSGDVESSFQPTINAFYGVRSIDATSSALVIGGEFTTVAGVPTRGFAIFPRATSADTQPPTVPDGLAVTGVTGTTVSLAWQPSTDNETLAGYYVYRDGQIVGATTQTSFTDTALSEATTYTYTVTAVDLAENESAMSDPVDAMTGVTLVPALTHWRYLDNGSNQGTAWQATAFNDAAWATGPAELGYGDGDEATVVSYGPNASNKYITTYFRRHFSLADANLVTAVSIDLLRDDGAVVYVNGTEVARSNMPGGTITYTTRAPSSGDESTYQHYTIDPDVLVSGDNVVAVEVHQQYSGSSDLSFDLSMSAELGGTPDVTPPSVPAGLGVTGSTQTGVSLAWSASTDDVGVAGYTVYRDGVAVGTPSGTSFTDSGLVSGTAYEYRVSARDTSGNESAQSAPVSATTGTPDVTPPSVPTGLAVTGSTQTAVSLAWSASTDDVGVAGYTVYRDGVAVGTPSGTSFTDSGLAPGTAYEYRVSARDTSANESAQSAPVSATTPSPPMPSNLIPRQSAWRYLDNGSNQGTAWQATAFDDASWAQAPGQFGYGDGDEATVVSYGSNQWAKHMTTYFRHTFWVTDPNQISAAVVDLLRDDGAVVYLNGTEITRVNMPTGGITYTTPASTGIWGGIESTYTAYTVNPSLFVAGWNTVAVEVHQNEPQSSDLSFDLGLTVTVTP
ncbi:MAG: fibronectin type III domain-containing protein [Acidimicrobiales bacterium]|nr:fibronectin type III domain-containing protein [Acidimicrobiales bacterium]